MAAAAADPVPAETAGISTHDAHGLPSETAGADTVGQPDADMEATATQAPAAGKRDMPASEGIQLNDEELEELVACVDSGLAADVGALRTELVDMLKQHAAKRQRGSPPEEQCG